MVMLRMKSAIAATHGHTVRLCLSCWMCWLGMDVVDV